MGSRPGTGVTPEEAEEPADERAPVSAGVAGDLAPVLGVEEVALLVRRLTVVTLEALLTLGFEEGASKGRLGLGVGSLSLPSVPVTKRKELS